MDLLAGYGSDSDSPPGSPAAAAPQTVAAPQPAPQGQEPVLPTSDLLARLPAPSTSKPSFFTGLPRPKKTRTLVAHFRMPIDYGPAPDKGAVGGADTEDADDSARRKRLKAAPSRPQSLAELLPPPVNAPGKRLEAEPPVLGGGGSARMYSSDGDDDEDFIPGLEDRSAMRLGAGEPAEEGAAPPAAPTGNEAYRVDGAAPQVPSHYIQGQHQGQQYYYDPATGQYFYPEAGAAPGKPPESRDLAVAALEEAVAAEAARMGTTAGSMQFKEVSGAAIRYLPPTQRAELNAVRSALGADYESRLRSDAAKVGQVSKLAKSRHQLASLYVQAKEQELEQIEKRTTGMKSKAETQRKYGW